MRGRHAVALGGLLTVPLLVLGIWGLVWPEPQGPSSDSIEILANRRPVNWSGGVKASRTTITPARSGVVTGVGFRVNARATSYVTGMWDRRKLLAVATTGSASSEGWSDATFGSAVAVRAGVTYTFLYWASPARAGVAPGDVVVRFRPNAVSPTAVASTGSTPSQPPVSGTSSSTSTGAAGTPGTPVVTGSGSQSPAPALTPSAEGGLTTPLPSPAVSSPRIVPTAPTDAVTTPAASTRPGAGGQTGCASQPSKCGYPDASNTGVPAGVTLKAVPGQVASGIGWTWNSGGYVNVTGDGAVLDGLEIKGSISVSASNVVIQNVRIVERGESFGIALRHANGVIIKDTEISSPDAGANRLMVGIKDIYGDSSGIQVLRTDISHTSTGIQMESGLIQDNYIHSMGYKSGDHVNGTTSNGGSSLLTIRHNTILNSFDQTDAISLFQDFGGQSNRVIDSNLLAGGGYTLYGGANPGARATSNIKITNNRFARLYHASGGYYGPVTAVDRGTGNVWSGNVWDDTAAAVNP